MPPKIRDVPQQLSEAGRQQVQQTGSHRQFKHPVHPGWMTVAGKPGDDVALGTLNPGKGVMTAPAAATD